MVRRISCYPLIGCFGLMLLEMPTVAHTVKVSGTIAATFHIEPHHNPKAGEPAKASFALTQQGGTSLSLAECDCTLAVYDQANPTQKKPIQTPVLQALSTEQYRDIPAATLVFPQAGNYILVLKGAPKEKQDFQPFQFSYPVTVAAGMGTGTSKLLSIARTAPHNVTAANHRSQITLAIACGTLASLGMLGFATHQRWHKRQ